MTERLRRLVLVGPMSGHPDFNYPAFDQAQAMLERLGYTVWSPTAVGRKIGFDKPAAAYLKVSIGRVFGCEGVAFLPQSTSPGSSAEIAVARAVGKPVASLADWVRFAREGDSRASVGS